MKGKEGPCFVLLDRHNYDPLPLGRRSLLHLQKNSFLRSLTEDDSNHHGLGLYTAGSLELLGCNLDTELVLPASKLQVGTGFQHGTG